MYTHSLIRNQYPGVYTYRYRGLSEGCRRECRSLFADSLINVGTFAVCNLLPALTFTLVLLVSAPLIGQGVYCLLVHHAALLSFLVALNPASFAARVLLDIVLTSATHLRCELLTCFGLYSDQWE